MYLSRLCTRSHSASVVCTLHPMNKFRRFKPLTKIRSLTTKAVTSRMTPEEKFLFDLNGFIVVRNLLTEEEVRDLNHGIDSHRQDAVARDTHPLKNAKDGTPMSAKESRIDLGGMLGWEGSAGDPFRKLLAHPRLAPYLISLLGQGYRLDHQPLVIIQSKDSEGFSLHGGPVKRTNVDIPHPDRPGTVISVPTTTVNPSLQYRSDGMTIWNSLVAMSVALCETKAGDGGFCAVPGSHKMNFSLPEQFRLGEDSDFRTQFLHQPATNPGDVIFFSEATVHGALPWRSSAERRLALYRFAPCNMAYGRAYTEDWGKDVLSKCSTAERAVLEAPYANRLGREMVAVEDSGVAIKTQPRSTAKTEHDKAIFGTSYF